VNTTEPLRRVIYSSNTEGDVVSVINQLLDAGALTHDEQSGKTVLHPFKSANEVKVQSHNALAFATVLARNPGLVDRRDRSGATPLIYWATQPELVKVLLDAKADVNAVDNAGVSALSCLISSSLKSASTFKGGVFRSTMRKLLRASADPTLSDINGETALMKVFTQDTIEQNMRTIDHQQLNRISDTAQVIILRDLLDTVVSNSDTNSFDSRENDNGSPLFKLVGGEYAPAEWSNSGSGSRSSGSEEESDEQVQKRQKMK
jgi:ankyrin repeat protein